MNRESILAVDYGFNLKEMPVLFVVESSPFAFLFETPEQAKASFSGNTIFNEWVVTLLETKFLVVAPVSVDSGSGATQKRIAAGAISYFMSLLPKGEQVLTRATHSQIHQVEKLWGQK